MSNNSADVNSTESNSSNWRQFDYEMIVPSFGYLIVLIFGLIGNGMTIVSTLWIDSLHRNPTYLVIMNQAIGDLITSVAVPAAWILVQFAGEQLLLDNELLCQVIAFCNLVFSSVALFSMALLAINRYLAIVHPPTYKRWFTIKKTGIFCAGTWIFAILLDAISYTDFGGRVYEPKIKSCFFERKKLGSLVIMASCCIVLPCVIISVCYLKIYLFVRKSTSRVQQQQSQSKSQKDRLALAKSLFMIFFVYSICWLPTGTVHVTDSLLDFSYLVFFYTRLLAYANAAINPLIYVLTNPTLREAYMFCLKKLFCSLVFQNLKLQRLDGRRDLTTQN
nr:G protein-coupled receptor [Proales similis]